MSALLEVKDLSVTLKLAEGEMTAVQDVSFEINRGETLGIVGESGSGKSVSSMAIMGLLPKGTRTEATKLRFGDKDLLTASEEDMARMRGDKIAMIFQEPMTSLNPVYTIGRQMTEIMQLHKGASASEARKRAIELLEKVGITAAENRLSQYPHQLSGGIRQRVMIAMMLMNNPDLIIADEPTTALDVTIQAQILNLLKDLQKELNIALIIISHDMGVVARLSDKIAVMYAGQVIESGMVRDVLNAPVHPYTQGLLESIPVPGQIEPGGKLGSIPGLVPSLKTKFTGCRFVNRCMRAKDACHRGLVALSEAENGHQYRCVLTSNELRDGTSSLGQRKQGDGKCYGSDINKEAEPILRADNAECVFSIRQGMFSGYKPLRAVDGISLDLRKGEVVAIVGESGCGKSTLARMLLGLQEPTNGTVTLEGKEIGSLSNIERSRKLQSIFQDPYSSLNPRRTIGEIICRPLKLHGVGNVDEQRQKVEKIMQRVGLPRNFYHNYPNQLSGGQRQRVAIARALILNPEIVVCDEPTSALDVSVQAQILNLLLELREEMGLTYLLITHDMAVVEHIATRVVVMYLGRVVEIADTRTLFSNPQHPYTRTLLKSVLTPEAGAGVPSVDLGTAYPNPINPPSGCTFHPRCEFASDICKSKAPSLQYLSSEHSSACHIMERETA